MKRLVCVSNRISLPRKSAAPGGLAVGILSALKRTGGLWFGWGGETCEGEPGEPDIHIREGVTYATIELRKHEFELYYNGYSNDVLWPLFHYFSKGMRYSNEQREAYENVNRIFAQRLLPLLQPRDLIWAHDYHLIPLGRRLRELGVQQPLGFFLHIPFPNIEMLRVLPCYAELLRDLTSYDVVGFQTQNDLRSFHSGIEHLFGADALRSDGRIRIGDRLIRAEVFPIGIDVGAVEAEAIDASATEVVRRMTDSLMGRSLMMGVDRLDYSKGLVERFSAYQQFLETHPENLGRITYLQIAPLSRTDVRAYAEIRQALEQAAGRTNGRFADTDWTPIRYLNRNFPHATLMGFIRAAKVGLVTPLRDGMNLVAKEFVAAQDPADPGVLILSSLAGAARELTSALLVNPYDVRGVSHAMQAALSMPLNERRERHADMMKVLRRNDIAAWTRRFMEALEQAQVADSRVRAITSVKHTAI
ncbi:trehalose-6-phosphate synthase [Steroidobacter sp. S1-65]|uniref:Trehalose-6-phosphate synthase n=1 Tax=Steroidobacter gossypii TaxID=2805490 RepID=A0ABS1WSF7_9GAMM|nr:trehalose-6-phosphate synthase [Steroidobacter gossypii]MBM0103914.1 trehalose-6-phosphate synthase [Steroidobacter gossypii]